MRFLRVRRDRIRNEDLQDRLKQKLIAERDNQENIFAII